MISIVCSIVFLVLINTFSNFFMLRGVLKKEHKWFEKFAITCITTNYALMMISSIVQIIIYWSRSMIADKEHIVMVIIMKMNLFFGFEASFLQIMAHFVRIFSIIVKHTTLIRIVSISMGILTIAASFGCMVAIIYQPISLPILPFPLNNFIFTLNYVCLILELILFNISICFVRFTPTTTLNGLISASSVDLMFRFMIVFLTVFQHFFIGLGVAENPEEFQFRLNIIRIAGAIVFTWILIRHNREKWFKYRSARVGITDQPYIMIEYFSILAKFWKKGPERKKPENKKGPEPNTE